MNHEIISIDQISSQQNLYIDNQQDQNSTQNDTKSKEMGSAIKQRKKSPMNPTPLYIFFSFLFQSLLKYFIREYSWWSTHQTETTVGTFVLLIILTMIVAIMIVCLAQPKPSGMIVLFYIEIT